MAEATQQEFFNGRDASRALSVWAVAQLHVDMVVVPRRAAALKADDPTVNTHPLGDVRFDEHLANATLSALGRKPVQRVTRSCLVKRQLSAA